MKRKITLFFALLFIPFISIFSQNSIQLNVDPAITSLNMGDVLISRDLKGQARYFNLQINTEPAGRRIKIIGTVDWKYELSGNYRRLFTFTSTVFGAKNLSSADIGNPEIGGELEINDTNLRDELIKKGKPSGSLKFTIKMFSENGEYLAETNPPVTLDLLNPSPTISILLPAQNSNVDVGNVQMSWTTVVGATRYEVKAVVVPETNQSIDEALSSQTPIVDAVVNTEIANLSQLKTREWFNGQKIVAVVKAFYTESGGETEIRSVPVLFTLGQGASNDSTSGVVPQPDANMVRLARIIGSNASNDFLSKLNDGTIKLDQVQIEDENGQTISSADFLILLTTLESKNPADLTITFTPKQ